MLRKSKNTNEGEEEEARTRASLVNIQIQLQQKEISAVWRRKSIVNKQMPNTTIRNILRTKTGIHSQQTNKNTTKRNIGRTLADIHSQHTNTNKTKRNIHRTEAGIHSQHKYKYNKKKYPQDGCRHPQVQMQQKEISTG